MDIQTKDGIMLRGIPDGTPDEAIKARIEKIRAERGPVDAAMPAAPKQSGDLLSSSVLRGVAGLAGLPGDVIRGAESGITFVGEKLGLEPKRSFKGVTAGREDIIKALEQATGDKLYKPEGRAERYIGGAIEGAASMPGRLPMMLTGAGSGLGAEGGEDVAGPVGRVVGALVAPGVQAARAVRGPVSSQINEATRGMTPAQWAAAQQIEQQGRALGQPVTAAEAIGNPRLLEMQSIVEQSRHGSPAMSQFMRQRAAGVEGAIRPEIDKVAAAMADPRQLGPRVQGAAEAAIASQRQAGNMEARPFYSAAEGQRVPPSTWGAMTQDPAFAYALEQVKKNRMLGLENEAEGSVRWIDAAKKYLDAAGSPSLGATALERSAAGAATRGAQTATGFTDVAVPDYATARAIVERNMRQNVNPRETGLTGELSRTPQAPEQINAILSEKLSRAPSIKAAAADIRATDPQALPDLVRLHLENTLDKALAITKAGPSEAKGAAFAVSLRKTPQLRQNLEAALGELPDGATRVAGLNKLLDVFEAQGRRLNVGSRTAFNQEFQKELSQGGILGTAAATAGSPGALITAARDAYRRFSYGGNTKELAEVLTRPNSVELLKELTKTKPDSARAAAIIGTLFAGQRATQGED